MWQNRLHLIIYILIPALCFFGASCERDDDEYVTPEVVPPGFPGQKLACTLIVYMAAENSLSEFVDSDSLEIARGLLDIPENTRVVLFIDDAKYKDNRSSRLCVGTRREPLQRVKVYDRNLCSTDAEDMSIVLSDIVRDYPADHYSLVFWSHASGWMPQKKANAARRRSFGIDNGQRIGNRYDERVNQGVVMEIPVMAQVLSRFPHLDYLLFDACFMQCIEVAYELRGVADYIIGSPAEIPGLGAPYDLLLPTMCQTPADVEGIVNGYVDYYESGKAGSPYFGAEMSLIRTNAMDTLALTTAPWMQAILKGRAEVDASQIQRYCDNSQSSQFTEYYDLKNWLYQASLSIEGISEEDYQAWCKVYDLTVPLTRLSPKWYSTIPERTQREIIDKEHCGGVSAFIPSSHYEQQGLTEAYHTLSWYTAAGINQTGW